MPRIVPSQVVELIDTLFPWAKDRSGVTLSSEQAGAIDAIVGALDNIAPELLNVTGAKLAGLLSAQSTMRHQVGRWLNSGSGELRKTPGFEGNPIAIVRDALLKCPDRLPSDEANELAFIGDPEFRKDLRADLGEVDRALKNADWKAATVLAGSVIEALLLWKLRQQDSKNVTETIASLPKGITRMLKPVGELDQWNLDQHIRVAKALCLVQDDTLTLAELAKDYRNLIHPGKSQRMDIRCDRGTALATIAALEHVARDLSR